RLARMVGGGFFDSIGSFLNKAKEIHGLSKPYVTAIKNALPEGTIKNVLSKVGYGKHRGVSNAMEQRLLKID
ncbi:MAG: hypothetical protein P4L31_02660, partial [Candidatus Babeliales bacterium]|nr:hypothetical protein [Candidatus Babeliales bacterium]